MNFLRKKKQKLSGNLAVLEGWVCENMPYICIDFSGNKLEMKKSPVTCNKHFISTVHMSSFFIAFPFTPWEHLTSRNLPSVHYGNYSQLLSPILTFCNYILWFPWQLLSIMLCKYVSQVFYSCVFLLMLFCIHFLQWINDAYEAQAKDLNPRCFHVSKGYQWKQWHLL